MFEPRRIRKSRTVRGAGRFRLTCLWAGLLNRGRPRKETSQGLHEKFNNVLNYSLYENSYCTYCTYPESCPVCMQLYFGCRPEILSAFIDCKRRKVQENETALPGYDSNRLEHFQNKILFLYITCSRLHSTFVMI